METLNVGRLALIFFLIAFAIFPKHQCGDHDDGGGGGHGGNLKKTNMMKWDDHYGGEEKIYLDFCVKDDCKEGRCWCCMILGRTDCYVDQAACESQCPPYPPP